MIPMQNWTYLPMVVPDSYHGEDQEPVSKDPQRLKFLARKQVVARSASMANAANRAGLVWVLTGMLEGMPSTFA